MPEVQPVIRMVWVDVGLTFKNARDIKTFFKDNSKVQQWYRKPRAHHEEEKKRKKI